MWRCYKMAKGLLIVYNPHNLLEFIWYYHTNKEARELTWDALCLPSGPNGQYMAPYCEKCGIFENVFSDSFAYSDGPVLKQLTLFLKMFGYFIVGQRKRFCKKILNKYIDPDSYKQFAVLSDFGIVSGAVLGAGLNTVIFEDGAADYEPRKNSNIFGDILNPFRIKGFLLAKMGYSNSAYFYPLRTTKNCIKYNSYPDKVPYR